MKLEKNKRRREVIINDCYGGFSISHKAMREWAKLKGISLQAYIFDWATHIKNPVDLNVDLDADGRSVNPICYEDERGNSISGREIPRDDSDLIKVVKKLGEKANGLCAELKIVEIPADVEWTIEEYDGMEWIAEAHRTWR